MEIAVKLCLIVLFCFKSSIALRDNRYYPRYHLAPPKGWMNDPNGFCVFKGEYHLFYQHNPDSSLFPGAARWGHAKSKDLCHWVDLGIALQNDTQYDRDGVFSGSAVIDSNVMYLFYTGHVNHTGQTPNHTEVQALATSYDGIHFTKYKHNPIILGKHLQPDIRDPKVWKHENNWYMVLGNTFKNEKNEDLGRVLLFKSPDKINWSQVSVLDKSDGYLGYMWECPDFFEIDGRFVLLFSPQGVRRRGDRFKNLYQTGYIIGRFNYKNNIFIPETEFRELDFGHDFYATQTILDNYGRRLLVAWLDMWKRPYPEGRYAVTGQMTIVRTLSLTQDDRLIQKPVREMVSARGNKIFEGKSNRLTKVTLSNRAGEVFITASGTQNLNLYIGNNTSSVQITYDCVKGTVSLIRDNTDDGLRRTKYGPVETLTVRVFIDASSIEVFFGEGLVTFSSRFFIDGLINVLLEDNSKIKSFLVYDMKTTLYNS